MARFKEEDLKRMGLIEDGKGGYRSASTREKQLMKPPSKKTVITHHNVADIDESCSFFIPGDVPSSKNSRRIFKDKMGVMHNHKSTACENYKKNTKNYWNLLGPLFKEKAKHLPLPLHIEFHFVYSKEFIWDYHNMVQFPIDLMVEFGWIADDDKKTAKPFFKDYSICRDKPGLYIKLL